MSQSINQSLMSSPSPLVLDHLTPAEQLCYVHCNFCNTVLAVSVPCTSMLKMVTVRCGHCSNLLSVNMRALLFNSPNQLHLTHPFFSPTPDLQESSHKSLLMDQPNPMDSTASSAERVRGDNELARTPTNRPPEKRQRVPSAYNRFIKDEIQRIKAGNPDITHREAFSTAAKNWAHFPNIHFGLMADQNMKKTNLLQQEGEDVMMNDSFFNAAANMGVAPY